MRRKTILYACFTSLVLGGQARGDEPRLFAVPPSQNRAEADEPASIDEFIPGEETPLAAEETAKPEVFRERYPNRAVKIERHVILDDQMNYVNHGPWTWLDERGQLIARGEYSQGQRHGAWVRIHTTDKNTLFAMPMYRGFERPLTSAAMLDSGELHGTWTVTDVKGRKVCHWHFQHGKQHGQSTWWHPSGQVQRTANYKEGLIDGELRDYNAKGELVAKSTFTNGRRLDVETNNHGQGKKRVERSVLVPIAIEHYNWFDATVALDRVQQEKVYHGPAVWWHPDGQKEMVGNFEHGVPHGTFTWWHANGQEHISGQYSHGKQEGKWTWWHANGQKEMEGDYQQGQRIGKWAAWDPSGKIRLAEEHPAGVDVPVIAAEPSESTIR